MLRTYTYHNDTGSQENPQTYWEFDFNGGYVCTGYNLTDYPASTAGGGLG